MRNWRPHHKCLYVIPEIHGSFKSLQIIVDRIFPLRFSINQVDRVIFLGDYIDKGSDTFNVLELLIYLKKNYSSQVFFIRGNHEQLLLNSFSSEEAYKKWLSQGGIETIASYIKNAGINSDAAKLPWTRLKDIIPNTHIEFLQSLPCAFKMEEYLFFHGGIDFKNGIEQTSEGFIVFDTSCSKFIKKMVLDKKKPLPDSDIIYVAAHNYKQKTPFVYKKYFMLGGGAPSKLIVFDLMSMKCAMIKEGKSRIYRHNFKFYE